MDFQNKQNLPAIFSSDPAAIAAAETAKARIQAAYIMALQKPRNEDDARVRILEACKRPKFAERVEFSKPVAGRSIKGPSVRFAELALREWGNVDTETQVIYEDDDIRRIKVRVLDLETNAGFSKELQIKKTVERKSKGDREVIGERTNTKGIKVYIVKATDDELENKQNALISKAVRNEGLRLIPSDITDEAIETAKATLEDKFAEDPKAEKKKILDSFSSIGIKPKDIEGYLKHSMDTVSPAELQDLRGMYRAIRDGEATWASYIEEKGPTEDLKEKIKNGKKGAAKDLYGKKDDKSPPTDNQNHILATQFEALAGIPLSVFENLRSKGVAQFAKNHRNQVEVWPKEIREIIKAKFKNPDHPEWAELIEPEEKPLADREAETGETDEPELKDAPTGAQREVLRAMMKEEELSNVEQVRFYAFGMGKQITQRRAEFFKDNFDELFIKFRGQEDKGTEPEGETLE